MTARAVPVLCLLACSLVPALGAAADPERSAAVDAILKTHCLSCHGPDTQEAGIRFDRLSKDLIADRAAAETWHEVLNALNAGEMPPEDASELSASELATVTGWIRGRIDEATAAQRKLRGNVVLRRLNRVEYQNTMTDLLGLEMNYLRDLPPDAVSPDGFGNDAQSLQISALQLETFLETARRALDRVIVDGPEPQVYDYEFPESNVRNWLGSPEISSRLGRQQVFLAKMVDEYPEEGAFRIRVTLSADLKADIGNPLLEVSVGYRPDTKILFRELGLVEITSRESQTFEFHGRIENFPLPVRGQGKFPGLVVRIRNVYDDGSPLPKGEKQKGKRTRYPDEPHLPTIQIESVQFRGPVFDRWPPATHRSILFDSPLRKQNEHEDAYVRAVLKRFMDRAYRRPVEDDEVQDAVDFYKSIRPEFATFEDAVRETLAMILIRPDFLYILEPGGEETRPLTDWELATRLSYFLWSTMPDDRLMTLAAAGELQHPEALTAEVERMLCDPRSARFIDQFTEQWLQLGVLDSVAIDRDYYPGFDKSLKQHMRAESQRFVELLIRENLSAMNLLSSDFTVLNEPLAKHYGIEGVYGREFRRVELDPRQHRGGLLGHAAILLSNSTGSDSHAVRRAVWIRDRLLDDPPAPPPPDVPPLDEADPRFHKLSIREQLEIHRERAACASCHRNIDPWGIALEHFDAVGLWRTEVRRKVGRKFETLPVNAVETLPGGQTLDGVDGLRSFLLAERRDDFARSLVSRLLTYALGRRLELADEEVVDDVLKQFASDEYRMRGLIHAIVASSVFQTR